MELVNQMEEYGLDPVEGYTVYLMSLHKAGLCEQMLKVFDHVCDAGYLCDDKAYDVVLLATIAAIKLRKRDLVFQILDEMNVKLDLSKASEDIFSKLVGAAIQTDQHQVALDLLDRIHENVGDRTIPYTTAVRTAFLLKRYDFVHGVLKKMVENGLDASGEFSHVVVSFNKAKCYKHLLRTYEAMGELGYHREEVLHKVALVAAIRLKQHEVVLEICNDKDNDDAGTDSYNFALETARNTKRHDLVQLLLDNVDKHTATGTPLDETRETTDILDSHLKQTFNKVAAYSTALREANEKKKDVELILNLMLKHSLDSDAPYYLYALRAANKAKQHDLVIQIDKHMANNGVTLTQDMCAVMLKSCGRVSDLDTALNIRSAMRRCGIKVTESIAYSLLKCAAKTDQWNVFIDTIAELPNDGLTPTMIMYTMGLNECEKRHHVDVAVDIYELMPEELRKKLVGRSLRAVVRGHALSNDKELQLRAVDIMNEHNDNVGQRLKLWVVDQNKKDTESTTPSSGIMDYLSSFFK